MKFRSLCVYCGSSPGRNPIYKETATETGRLLAEHGIELIYGAGNVGLMGAVANGALEAGGKVTGVIPEGLVDMELAHHGLTTLEVVKDMHERKACMAELAEGFIALPGGMGTLDELCEILCWLQLDIHRKPVGLVNIEGYFDGFLSFIDHTVEERFFLDEHRQMILHGANAREVLTKLEAFTYEDIPQWVDRQTSGSG